MNKVLNLLQYSKLGKTHLIFALSALCLLFTFYHLLATSLDIHNDQCSYKIISHYELLEAATKSSNEAVKEDDFKTLTNVSASDIFTNQQWLRFKYRVGTH